MAEEVIQTCAKCLSEIPAGATRCRHCGANPSPAYDWEYAKKAGSRLAVLAVIIIGGIANGSDAGAGIATVAGGFAAYYLLKVLLEVIESTKPRRQVEPDEP